MMTLRNASPRYPTMSDTLETATQCRPPNEELGAEFCSALGENRKLLAIWSEIDRIMITMQPRHINSVTMCGKYPAWSVWLPEEGRTLRKSLKAALVDYHDQLARVEANASDQTREPKTTI